jgi:hypothetical protein
VGKNIIGERGIYLFLGCCLHQGRARKFIVTSILHLSSGHGFVQDLGVRINLKVCYLIEQELDVPDPRCHKAGDAGIIKGRFIHDGILQMGREKGAESLSLLLKVNAIDRLEQGFPKDTLKANGLARLSFLGFVPRVLA